MGYINYLSTGAGFLKSTVEPKIFLRVEQIVAQQQIAFEIKPASVMLSVYKCCWNCCKCCGPGPHPTVIDPKFCHGNSHICFSPSVSKSQCQLTQIWLRKLQNRFLFIPWVLNTSTGAWGIRLAWQSGPAVAYTMFSSIKIWQKKMPVVFFCPKILLKKYRQKFAPWKTPMGSNGRW